MSLCRAHPSHQDHLILTLSSMFTVPNLFGAWHRVIQWPKSKLFLSWNFRALGSLVQVSTSDEHWSSTHLCFADMRRGRKLSPEIQWAVIQLSRLLNNDQIAMSLDVSTSSIKRILSHFRAYGDIPYQDKNLAKENRRGNRHLRDVDVEVSHWLCNLCANI